MSGVTPYKSITNDAKDVTNSLNVNGITNITDTTQSTSTTTGALTIAGGVGVGKNLNVGGDINDISINSTTGGGLTSKSYVLGTSTTAPSINNTSALSNILIGSDAGNALTTADFNIAIGNDSLSSVITNGNNVCVGTSSGKLVTGTGNVCLGHQAGNAITTGNNNISIGRLSDCADTHVNQIAIGYNTVCDISNQCTIGDSNLAVIRPGSDDTCNLGTSDRRFKDCNLSGELNVSSGSMVVESTTDSLIWIKSDTDNVTESDNASMLISQDGERVWTTIGYDQSSSHNNDLIIRTGSDIAGNAIQFFVNGDSDASAITSISDTNSSVARRGDNVLGLTSNGAILQKNLTIESDTDSLLWIKADTDNATEDDNGNIIVSQDGQTTWSTIGYDQLSSYDNDLIIRAGSTGGGRGIQFFTGGNSGSAITSVANTNSTAARRGDNVFGLTSNGATVTGDLDVSGNIDFSGLPTSDPNVSGRLWNSSGTLKISSG